MSGHRAAIPAEGSTNASSVASWPSGFSPSQLLGQLPPSNTKVLLSLPVNSIHYQLNDQIYWQAPVSKRPRSHM